MKVQFHYKKYQAGTPSLCTELEKKMLNNAPTERPRNAFSPNKLTWYLL